jgi:hypothetical protein
LRRVPNAVVAERQFAKPKVNAAGRGGERAIWDRLRAGHRSGGCMEKRKAYVKAVVLLSPGKWGIVLDYVLEEKRLIGKEVLINYDEMQGLNETHDGFLMIETVKVPLIKRGDTIELTIRDRRRK